MIPTLTCWGPPPEAPPELSSEEPQPAATTSTAATTREMRGRRMAGLLGPDLSLQPEPYVSRRMPVRRPTGTG